MQSFRIFSENKEPLTGLRLRALLSHTLLKASCVSVFEKIRQGIYENITVINSSRLVAEFTCRRNFEKMRYVLNYLTLIPHKAS